MRLPQRLAVTHKDGSVPHWHDNEQILVTVSGMYKLTVDGKTSTHIRATFFFFPVGSRHLRDRHQDWKAASTTKSSRPPVRDQLPGWIGPSVLRYD
jgi:quercetin dioxygenase-like cupin family protein